MVPPKRAKKTAEDFRREWAEATQHIRSAAFQGIEPPSQPKYKHPTLPTQLAEVSDRDLIDFMVRYTRWADYFSAQVTYEEISEAQAEKAVKRLEELYMLQHRPEKPQSGDLTLLKAEMQQDGDILEAREAARTVYARRKLQQMLMEAAERDEAVCSRELTRRTEMDKSRRRADRNAP